MKNGARRLHYVAPVLLLSICTIYQHYSVFGNHYATQFNFLVYHVAWIKRLHLHCSPFCLLLLYGGLKMLLSLKKHLNLEKISTRKDVKPK